MAGFCGYGNELSVSLYGWEFHGQLRNFQLLNNDCRPCNLLWFPCIYGNIAMNIVTHKPIARQRFCKHIPEAKLSTIGYPLLDNGPITTHYWQQKMVFSVGPCRGIIRGHIQENWRSTREFSWKSEEFHWSVQSEEDDSVSMICELLQSVV
jgi:hypothetical protein